MSQPGKLTRAALGLGAALPVILFDAPVVVQAQDLAPIDAIACTTPGDVWAYLNATEQNDRETLHLLLGGTCRMLRGARYILIGNRNGMEKILVFDHSGDWQAARVFYALADSMD